MSENVSIPENTCPRRMEGFGPWERKTGLDAPREDGTCSFCGSISADALFAAIEAGCELGPTDKNYKIYVDRAEPNCGKPSIRSKAYMGGTWDNKPAGEGWIEATQENVDKCKADGVLFADRLEASEGHYFKIGAEGATRHDKFYFQHLSADQQNKFIELLNANRIKIGYPGYFYRLPFFCQRITPSEAANG